VAGALAGFAITRGITRAMIQLSVPVTDTAGKLGEVVGPITLSGGWEFSDLQASMESIGSQVGAVVERLQRSQRDALRAEQLAAVGQLAAGMAHELRNPLTSMKLLVQGASRDGSVGLYGRDLAVFGEEITRVERLVQTLLDFARPPQPNRTSFDLAELVKESANFVAPQAEPKNIRLQCRLPQFPVWIKADQGQIRQVLLNLLLNAFDAVPDNGEIKLEVLLCSGHARPEDAPVAADSQLCSEGNLTIRVADNGPGVPVELADRLFDPFVSNKPTGIGLGLSICKRIVEAHGGTMNAENSPGGGAVFSVHLPLTPLSPDHCAKASRLFS
jgi:two-component system sensor histidine kinase HydH